MQWSTKRTKLVCDLLFSHVLLSCPKEKFLGHEHPDEFAPQKWLHPPFFTAQGSEAQKKEEKCIFLYNEEAGAGGAELGEQ